MFKFKYFRWTLLMLLFLFVILSSLNVGVAEFYSRSIYPSLSYVRHCHMRFLHYHPLCRFLLMR